MTDINQLGLVRIDRCPTCEAQAAGLSRFTKAEEETLRKHVKHLSAKHVQIMHENVALQMENERLHRLLSVQPSNPIAPDHLIGWVIK